LPNCAVDACCTREVTHDPSVRCGAFALGCDRSIVPGVNTKVPVNLMAATNSNDMVSCAVANTQVRVKVQFRGDERVQFGGGDMCMNKQRREKNIAEKFKRYRTLSVFTNGTKQNADGATHTKS
jgi:hypothetical protein